MLDDFLSEEARLRPLLADMQRTLVTGNELIKNVNLTVDSVDRVVARLDLSPKGDMKESEPVDINEYRQLVSEASKTVNELTLLMQSIEVTLESPVLEQNVPRVLNVVEGIDEDLAGLVNRVFLLAALIIVVFFAAMLAFRYASARLPGVRT